MGRANGKHEPRRSALTRLLEEALGTTEQQQTEGERRQEGIGAERFIPGGLNHLANPPVKEQAVPVPATEYPFSNAILAHGVEPEGHMHVRDPRLSGGQRGAAELQAPPPQQTPVPVYLVEKSGGARAMAFTGTHKITLPANSGVPVQILMEDPHRALVQLLNEDSTNNARIGQLGDLLYDTQNAVMAGGARLPADATSYTVLRTQGPLWGIADASSPVVISVITEFEIPGAL